MARAGFHVARAGATTQDRWELPTDGSHVGPSELFTLLAERFLLICDESEILTGS